MAKFKLENRLGNGDPVWAFFNSYETFSKSDTKLVITSEWGSRIEYKGTGFEFNGVNGTAGIVKKVQFFDEDDHLLMSIKDGHFRLERLNASIISNFDVFSAANDFTVGTKGDDWLRLGSNKGDDEIRGLQGNDSIGGSPGSNIIDGGSGNHDSLTYAFIPCKQGINANLVKGKIENAWGKVDTVSGIEELEGTDYSDRFVGTAQNEFFAGHGGNDRFTGGGGKDTFYFSGSSDRDFYSDFGKGNDTIELFATSCDTFTEIKSRLTQDGKNTVLNFGDGEIMTFLNFDKDDFIKSDFEFIY